PTARYPLSLHDALPILNLLLALHALLAERHVTRAAKRCHLSQSAMSRALERLRQMFGDRLLVRSGRAYERTGRGERVLRELESLDRKSTRLNSSHGSIS